MKLTVVTNKQFTLVNHEAARKKVKDRQRKTERESTGYAKKDRGERQKVEDRGRRTQGKKD